MDACKIAADDLFRLAGLASEGPGGPFDNYEEVAAIVRRCSELTHGIDPAPGADAEVAVDDAAKPAKPE